MGLLSQAKKDEEFCQGVQQWIQTTLQEHARRDHNLIWSDEDLLRAVQNQPQYLQVLATIFQDFEIEVVVGYRRYYEWILSEYYQEQKQGIGKHIKHRTQTYRPFWEWYTAKLDLSQQVAVFFPSTQQPTMLGRMPFANIHVFNLHYDTTSTNITTTTANTPPISMTSKTKKNVANHRIPPAKAIVQEAIHQGWIPLERFALATNLLLKALQESESKNTSSTSSTGVPPAGLLTPVEALPLLVAPTESIDLAAVLERSQDLEALLGGVSRNTATPLLYTSNVIDLKTDFEANVVKSRIYYRQRLCSYPAT